jgi:flagellar protein FlaI
VVWWAVGLTEAEKTENEVKLEAVVREYDLGKFTHIKLVFSLDEGMKYVVEEPVLDDLEKRVLSLVKEKVIDSPEIDIEDRRAFREQVLPLIQRYYRWVTRIKEPPMDRIEAIFYYVERDIIGFGKLDPVLRDPNIEDIHISGTRNPVFVWYTKYDLIPTNIFFSREEDLWMHVQKVMFASGKQVSYTNPIVDATLPGGLRVHIVHQSVSPTGAIIVIRKHRQVPMSVLDLIASDMGPPELFAYLWTLVENKASVLIIGETASGKTTLLNAIASFIPYNMKIVVVEEVRELNLPHPTVSYMVTKETMDTRGKVTLFDLVKAAMRQRPDYIIVGEIRGEEAYALFQAMSLGHGGLGTMHADSPVSAVKRLMMKPLEIPPYMIKELDTIVHTTKIRLGGMVNRYIVTVADLKDIDDERREPIFEYVYKTTITEEGLQKHLKLENSYALRRIAEQKGIPLEYFFGGMKRKKRFLEESVKKGLSYSEFIHEVVKWWMGIGVSPVSSSEEK